MNYINLARAFCILVLVSILYQSIYALLQLYNIIPINSVFRITGTFGNPNQLAEYISSGVPLALGFVLFNKHSRLFKIVGTLVCLFGILVLPATYIRSSWLAAIAGVTVLLYYRYHSNINIKSVLVNSKLVLIVVAVSLCSLLFVSNYLYQLKPDSVNGRLLIWKISLSMAAENPITGIGHGNYQRLYNLNQGDYFAAGKGTEKEKMLAGNVQHAHNEYLQIFVEYGVFGLLPVFAFLWYILYKVRLSESNEAYEIQVALKSSIIAILVSAMFSFPLQVLPTVLNLALFCSLFMILEYRTKINKTRGLVLSFVAIIIIGNIGMRTIEKRSLQAEWDKAIELTLQENHENALLLYTDLYPRLKSNPSFLFMLGGAQSATGNYRNAINILHESEKGVSDPNLFMVLGDSYEAVGDFDKAHHYYIKAWHIIPHKFFPLYKLMQLYYSNGYIEESLSIAKQITGMREKIPSPATKQIKRDAAIFLSSGVAVWLNTDENTE